MISLNKQNGSRAAVVESDDIVLNNAQDALDLMATARYELDCGKIAVDRKNICDDFFELKTGLAGEILQKYSNYGVKIAIFGDFESLKNGSRSLNDFIYECNQGNQVFFLPTKEEALERLHGAEGDS